MQHEHSELEQIVTSLRAEFQEMLGADRAKQAEETRKLQAEIEYLRGREPAEEWIEASQSRNHGNCELPERVQELFNRDSVKNRKDHRCVFRALSEYPKPKGGWLEPQAMDAYTVTDEYKKNEDANLMDAQRYVLHGIRPSLAVEFIISDESKSDAEKLESISRINYDNILLHLHFAQEIRVSRRVQAARKFDLAPKSDSHYKVGSADDSVVFGQELLKVISDEKAFEKSRKNAQSNGKEPSGGFSRGQAGSSERKTTNRGPYKTSDSQPKSNQPKSQ